MVKILKRTDVPVNKMSALVTSTVGAEKHFWYSGKTNQIFWDHKPETYKFYGPREHDLTGKEFGRMVVVGYFGRGARNGQQNKGGCLWVVRCACGRYELKRTKAVKNKKNILDRCDSCRKLVEMKRAYNYHVLGKQ